MNAASKVDAILNAWFDYIALDDYSNARIEAASQDTVKQRGIKLVSDHVFIEPTIFLELQQKVAKEQQSQQETLWALSFPQFIDVDNKKSYFCPLFSLDVTSILKGEYREAGWSLDELKLMEAGNNLATFLGLDDEQRERLITQDGLRRFLETTFGQEFQTYEEWMRNVSIPRSRYQIQRQPYLFAFTGAIYSRNLKQDLKEIKSGSKNWLKPKHPAYEYLFGVPRLPEHEVTYMGAFPTNVPTNSQSTALKHAQTEPITAVQGPPGSGKTTLILHLIAQQVVQRALRLIESNQDINNLTVISSTNNKAVENVIEKLDDWLKDESLEHDFLYLKGGSKFNIQSPGGALEDLQQALDYLQINRFDQTYLNTLIQKIKQIKNELEFEESNFLEERRQRTLDEERLTQLVEKIQALEQYLEEILTAKSNSQRRARQLSDYDQLPVEAYRQLEVILNTAKMRLPEGKISWWKKILLWFSGRTEKQIVTKTAEACQPAILNTVNTIFPVKVIETRNDLIQQAWLVSERLTKADELKTIQNRLKELSGDIASTEQQRDKASRELTFLENRLATPLEDFYAYFHQNFHNQQQELFELSRKFLTQQALCYKERVKGSLELYSNVLAGGNWKDKKKMAENLNEHIKNVSLFFPVITSTLLSIRNILPWVEECVDRTIVDEAGMIDLHKTFPLLVRSRKAIIVGDPLQIEPVITLSNQRRDEYRQTAFLDTGLTEIDYHRYSPEEEYSATTYHRAAGASGEDNDQGQGICLIEHYRCQPSIIEYCNAIAKYGLEVKTPPVTSLVNSNLVAYHVEGSISRNVNEEEVSAVGDVIQHLQKQGYSLQNIGVISPFNVHARALREYLTQKFSGLDAKSVGTIHTFQGSEKKVIILSTKVCGTQDNVNWINNRPNLLNVAVSRAKELFILVGNLYRLEKGKLTRQLVEHIREYGDILDYKSEAEIPQPQPGATLIYDCDHLKVFRDAIEQAEEELAIVTPWIRDDESKRFVNDIVSALEKGVKVRLIYGSKSSEENDGNDVEIEKNLEELFCQYPGSYLNRLGKKTFIESRGTNEKILVCDTKFAIVGSWNWLSHPYRKQCSRSLINSKVQIRRETSIQVSDSLSIEDIKARIIQLITP
ncbi:MAG: AAA domain-containing protein [Nostoc sp. ChiSLP02]|nr:AAA domain-containing protein [Nostoc sp. DedSLP05]MDZ8098989.1 AAA domain-containing protein [Nostoc sp. DedSLP01]MDZ8185835.1 AAA domain-containing protein [Nostoc sp. ChiSLP02]